MSKPKVFSALLLVTALGFAAPVFAQPGDVSGPMQTERSDDNDNSGLLGLVGLLGSIGLLGLKRRHGDEHQVRRTTNVPMGAQSH